MANKNNNITKADMISYFTTNLRNKIRDLTVWYGSTATSVGNTTGFPFHRLSSTKDPGGPSVSSLGGEEITAADIANVFHAWADQYTRVRNLRFDRNGNIAPVDLTRLAHMNDLYRQSTTAPNTLIYYVNSPPGSPASKVQQDRTNNYTSTNVFATAGENNVEIGETITASNFNAFVNNLYNKWNVQKNNTVYYLYYWCHSNCHQSCHQSFRLRR